MVYQRVIRPFLFRFDSESVHEWTSQLARSLLGKGPGHWLGRALAVRDPVTLFGLTFPNRVGLAAGFDKKALFTEAAEALGFGHIEVGAVTPLPQPGHPRPRMFRHLPQGCLRNRMGFNNDGAVAIAGRLAKRRSRFPVGVNLGKGKDTPLERAAEDYQATLELLFPFADFFVLNVSSPNTAGLRDLQHQLGGLLNSVAQSNQRQSQRFALPARPLLVKISPDEDEESSRRLVEAAAEAGADGVVATNTTIKREGPCAAIPELGGLSGRVLKERSLERVGQLRDWLGPDFPIIGVGGIDDESSARAMRRAGADLIQVYTGFVFQGPTLPRRLSLSLKETR